MWFFEFVNAGQATERNGKVNHAWHQGCEVGRRKARWDVTFFLFAPCTSFWSDYLTERSVHKEQALPSHWGWHQAYSRWIRADFISYSRWIRADFIVVTMILHSFDKHLSSTKMIHITKALSNIVAMRCIKLIVTTRRLFSFISATRHAYMCGNLWLDNKMTMHWNCSSFASIHNDKQTRYRHILHVICFKKKKKNSML